MRQSSLDGVLRPDRVFGNLRADILGAFEAIKAVAAYSGNTVLFREGHMARGIFLVCEGKVRLSVSSASGRKMTVRVAGPGEVLGLSAVFSGSPYEVSAETRKFAGRHGHLQRSDRLPATISRSLFAGSTSAQPQPACRLRSGARRRIAAHPAKKSHLALVEATNDRKRMVESAFRPIF